MVKYLVDSNYEMEDTCKVDFKRELESPRVKVMRKPGKYLEKSLLSMLPHLNYDVKDLHVHDIALPGVFLFFVAWVGAFITLFITGVQTSVGSKFLSLDGSSSSQTCQDVPVAITGNYEIDMYGRWSTDAAFKKNTSMFQVNFQASEISMNQYQSTINKFAKRIIEIDKILASNDVTISAVAWSTLYMKDDATRMSVATTADWRVIFTDFVLKIGYVHGFVQQYDGSFVQDICRAQTDANFPEVDDSSGGLLKLKWALLCADNNMRYCDWNSVIQPCGNLFHVSSSGDDDPYIFVLPSERGSRIYSTPQFSIDMDIRSLLIAYALNIGLLDFNDFSFVDTDIMPGVVSRQIIHPNFPGIGMVVCYVIDAETFSLTGDAPMICGFKENLLSHFYYPAFDTYQLDSDPSTTATNCDCPANANNYKCQGYNFMLRVVTWPYAGDQTESIAPLIELAKTELWKTNKLQALREYFRATLNDLTTQCPSNKCVMYNIAIGHDEANPFLNSFGLSLRYFQNASNVAHGYNGDGSDYFIQNINCKPSLYRNQTWLGIAEKPPTPLSAPYKTCQLTMSAAIQNTIGNANNIATAIASFILSIYLGYFVSLRNYNMQSKSIMSTSEKLDYQITVHNETIKRLDNLAGATSTAEFNAFLAYEEESIHKLKSVSSVVKAFKFQGVIWKNVKELVGFDDEESEHEDDGD